MVKRQGLSAKNEKYLFLEARLLQKLQHDHIIKLHSMYENSEHYSLVLEYVDGGELFDRIVQKNFYNEAEAREAVQYMMSALHFCHMHNVIHRFVDFIF